MLMNCITYFSKTWIGSLKLNQELSIQRMGNRQDGLNEMKETCDNNSGWCTNLLKSNRNFYFKQISRNIWCHLMHERNSSYRKRIETYNSSKCNGSNKHIFANAYVIMCYKSCKQWQRSMLYIFGNEQT